MPINIPLFGEKIPFERQFKIYEAEKYDENHQLIPNALAPKGYTHQIKVNPPLNYFKAKQKEKASLRFTRFTVRGKENAKREVCIALMTSNIRRLVAKAAKR